MHRCLVLSIDITTGPPTATLADESGHLEHLPLPGDVDSASQQSIVAVAAARAAVAQARIAGVVTGPDRLELTHPPEWTSEQIEGVRTAAAAAGFTPDQVSVRARSVDGAPPAPGWEPFADSVHPTDRPL